MKQAIKMIVLDLDNTLLKSDKTISDYTVDILKKCQASDIKIVFATARSTQASEQFFARFMPDIFIGYGGALVMCGDKIIHRFDIPPQVANQIINDCLHLPQVTDIHAINELIALSNKPSPDMRHYKLTDFSGEQNNHYLKISIVANDPAVVEDIASRYPMCDMLRYSGEDLYKFANRNATKWQAIKAIAKRYGLDTDTFVAFGDDIIDLEMIQNCGIGIAVKNAVPKVLSAAKSICDTSDNDGVAKWLEANVLE